MKTPALILRKIIIDNFCMLGNKICQSIISLGLDQHCPIELYAIILNNDKKLHKKKPVGGHAGHIPGSQ